MLPSGPQLNPQEELHAQLRDAKRPTPRLGYGAVRRRLGPLSRAIFHGTGALVWIGILLMIAGVGISITLLFVLQHRAKVAGHGDGIDKSSP